MRSTLFLAMISVFAWSCGGYAQTVEHTADQQNVVHGAPLRPTEAWTLAAGGRIYDNWWEALDRDEPKETHRAYPTSGQRKGSTTWRCVECHGWDYKGKDGPYGTGERYTGIKGIRDARRMPSAQITRLIRSDPHNYTSELIRDDELMRLVTFIRDGQHDADRFIMKTGQVKGDTRRGATIFQTVCAVCHGYDGRQLDWGKPGEPAYVGTEARKLPAEVLHKIRNGHPGAAMVNMRAFPLEDAVDVLAFAQTLPSK